MVLLRFLTILAGLSLGLIAEANASTTNRVLLPVEIAGDAGTSVSVTVHVPPGLGKQAHSLWMQVHGMAYAGMASVRINQGPWWPLRNETVAVAEPGKSYGGIGGGFATLKLTLPLPDTSVVDDSNTIQFRFNRTDGIVSGFRVLAFNFLAADGRPILPAENVSGGRSKHLDTALQRSGKHIGRAEPLGSCATHGKQSTRRPGHSRTLLRLPYEGWPGSQVLQLFQCIDRRPVPLPRAFGIGRPANRKLYPIVARA